MPDLDHQELAAIICGELFKMKDDTYKAFHQKLMPTVDESLVIGVRTPMLRAYAKSLKNSQLRVDFLKNLPHKYYEENNLHAFLIEQEADFDNCLYLLDRFLPYVDNWATCDMMNPKVLKKHKPELLEKIKLWLSSGDTYTVRFGLRMLMVHFLDDDFSVDHLLLASSVDSTEYYINMMIAWFFATALTKRYKDTLPFIEEKRLCKWCHNKAISKARDSFQISPDKKEYLLSLRIK